MYSGPIHLSFPVQWNPINSVLYLMFRYNYICVLFKRCLMHPRKIKSLFVSVLWCGLCWAGWAAVWPRPDRVDNLKIGSGTTEFVKHGPRCWLKEPAPPRTSARRPATSRSTAGRWNLATGWPGLLGAGGDILIFSLNRENTNTICFLRTKYVVPINNWKYQTKLACYVYKKCGYIPPAQ